jgi:hypothetical protein
MIHQPFDAKCKQPFVFFSSPSQDLNSMIRNIIADRISRAAESPKNQTNQIATTQILRLRCRQTAEKPEKQPTKPKTLAGRRMFDEFLDLTTD